jgi:hypothetical protein
LMLLTLLLFLILLLLLQLLFDDVVSALEFLKHGSVLLSLLFIEGWIPKTEQRVPLVAVAQTAMSELDLSQSPITIIIDPWVETTRGIKACPDPVSAVISIDMCRTLASPVPLTIKTHEEIASINLLQAYLQGQVVQGLLLCYSYN